MQKLMRRTLGVGGATMMAVAASLALAGVASAHNHDVTATCVTKSSSPDYGKSQLNISLTDYTDKPNSVVVTATESGKTTTLYSSKDFTPQYVHTSYQDGTAAESYEVKVVAHSKQFSFDTVVTTKPCPQPTTTTTTTVPPTTTKDTPPPTTTKDTPPTAPASTTSAAVAPVSDKTATPPGGLAYTGVSTELPLIIGGVLIVLGAGALFTMRIMKRRRAES
jgi:hypothetical protein